MRSVLSYFSSYFQPDTVAPLSNHSTGQIAGRQFGWRFCAGIVPAFAVFLGVVAIAAAAA